MSDFTNFYNNDLLPILSTFEVRRKKICKTIVTTIAILTAIAAVLIVATGETVNPGPVMIISAIMSLAIITLTSLLVTKGFRHEFKIAVVEKIVKFIDPGLQYSPQSFISQDRFLGSRIFETRIDRYRGEDCVSGKVGSTAIEFSELHAEYKTVTTDSKGRRHTHWHTIFKGLFFTADFNKDFKGLTVVLPDTAEKLFGFLGKSLQSMNLCRGKLVRLEDPEFEKLFVVYSDDQIEARYILSTSLMQRISAFRMKTGCQTYLSFVSSRVNIAIKTKRNMFEPRIFRTLLSHELVREYLDDLQLAVGIVEDLNLNTRIWSKA